ncbi:MAG: hypothetical protein FH749_14090 [Firmicutes bacterium]|nr:hypothetical protein [Bacillota bacterium]
MIDNKETKSREELEQTFYHDDRVAEVDEKEAVATAISFGSRKLLYAYIVVAIIILIIVFIRL